MRRTKNITVAVSERAYYEARVYVTKRRMSISSAVQFLLTNLETVSEAIEKIRIKDPSFGTKGRH